MTPELLEALAAGAHDVAQAAARKAVETSNEYSKGLVQGLHKSFGALSEDVHVGLEALTKDLESKTTEDSVAREQIKALRDTTRAEITGIRSDTAGLDGRVSAVEENALAQSVSLDDLRGLADAGADTVVTLGEQISEVRVKAVAAVEVLREEMEARVLRLTKDLDAAEEAFVAADRQLSERLSSTTDVAKSAAENAATSVGLVDAWRQALAQRVEDFENEVRARQKRYIEDLEDRIVSIQKLLEEKQEQIQQKALSISAVTEGPTGPQGPAGPEGPKGALERVLRHQKGMRYTRGLVVYSDDTGASYQALRDTDTPPGGEDWQLVTRGIRDVLVNEDAGTTSLTIQLSDGRKAETGDLRGLPGKSITPRGTYDPQQTYWGLDLVVSRNQSWLAKHDDPGELPGPGWVLLARKGGQGPKGDRGVQGPPGPPGEGMRWAGEYDPDYAPYPPQSVVRIGKAIWVALENTSDIPGNPGAPWSLMIDFGRA